jgi:hypothetical protein
VHLLLPALQASPDCVQKSAATLWPLSAPLQHGMPSLPQPPQALLLHVPRPAPQLCPPMRQAPSTQQRLPLHVSLSQQGWP